MPPSPGPVVREPSTVAPPSSARAVVTPPPWTPPGPSPSQEIAEKSPSSCDEPSDEASASPASTEASVSATPASAAETAEEEATPLSAVDSALGGMVAAAAESAGESAVSSAYLDSSVEDASEGIHSAASTRPSRRHLSFNGFETLGDTTPASSAAQTASSGSPLSPVMQNNPVFNPGSPDLQSAQSTPQVAAAAPAPLQAPGQGGPAAPASPMPSAPANTPAFIGASSKTPPVPWSEVKAALRSRTASRAPSDAGAPATPFEVRAREAEIRAFNEYLDRETPAKGAPGTPSPSVVSGPLEGLTPTAGPSPLGLISPVAAATPAACPAADASSTSAAWPESAARHAAAAALVALPLALGFSLALVPQLSALAARLFAPLHERCVALALSLGLGPLSDAAAMVPARMGYFTPLFRLLAGVPGVGGYALAADAWVTAAADGVTEAAVALGALAAARYAEVAEAALELCAVQVAAMSVWAEQVAAVAAAELAALDVRLRPWLSQLPGGGVEVYEVPMLVASTAVAAVVLCYSVQGVLIPALSPAKAAARALQALSPVGAEPSSAFDEAGTGQGSFTFGSQFGTPLNGENLASVFDSAVKNSVGRGETAAKSGTRGRGGRAKAPTPPESFPQTTPVRASRRLHARQTGSMLLRDLDE